MARVFDNRLRLRFKVRDGKHITISERLTVGNGTTRQKQAILDHAADVLRTLYGKGKLDILRNIVSGVLTVALVVEAQDNGTLDSLPSVQTIQPLKDTLTAWVAKSKKSEATKASYRNSFTQLLKFGSDSSTVADLPDLLDKMKEAYSDKARAFNITRSGVQAFIRATLKRSNPLYLAVWAIEPLKVQKKRQGNPLSYAGLLELVAKLPEEVGSWFYSMAVTGMNVLEYANGWEIDGTVIHIFGTKRETRNRPVPLIVDAKSIVRPPKARPHIGTFVKNKDGELKYHRRSVEGVKLIQQAGWYKELRKALNTASKNTIQPHDARRTYSRILEEAGLWESHRDGYMGHGKTMRTLYNTPRVCAEMIEADRQKLIDYLTQESKKQVNPNASKFSEMEGNSHLKSILP